jgi:hypothetical protein
MKRWVSGLLRLESVRRVFLVRSEEGVGRGARQEKGWCGVTSAESNEREKKVRSARFQLDLTTWKREQVTEKTRV